MSEVMTVRGTVDSSELGFTLTHEHIVNDVSSWWQASTSDGIDPDRFASAPVSMDLLWELRQDPFGNRDNCRLDDLELAVAEVARYAAVGGRTIVETTGLGIGRDLARLREVSERTGVHVVAGTGYYLDGAQPASTEGWSPDAYAEAVLADLAQGEDGVRPGIIGEIGVGSDFTDRERRSLRGACRAQVATGLPMQVHLPGWFRLGEAVLDVTDAEGVDPGAVVLCHSNPSGADRDYQRRLLARGAWVQYDMVGAELFYADQQTQCTSDDEDAAAITRLVADGFGDRLLVSSDVFLKSLLRHYGGPGYAHVPQYFVPRLHRHGMTADQVEQLTVTNPRRLFELASATTPATKGTR